DEPTDAVEDYCRYLGEALASHNLDLQIRRVPWKEHGWSASLRALRLQTEAWRGAWVLVQYTALAWSARGFPRRFLRVLRILRKSWENCGCLFLAGMRKSAKMHFVKGFEMSRWNWMCVASSTTKS